MKISLQWLAEYLPGHTDAQQAADALTNSGLPTEHIDRLGDDLVLDVEVTSNRGDCLSHVGVARELSAVLNRQFVGVEPKAAESSADTSQAVKVSIEVPDLCPHYTARVIKNVKIGPSPEWMKRRLEAVGLRSINNIVDVTNYVMFEMGQPLHAFDFDKIGGKEIIVRPARLGEKIVSIDGHERRLTSDMLVIADAQRPVALAGVMGGKDSEVSEGTVNVLLESARFDPLCVRKTARKLALLSDSSYRFERSIDPTLPERAGLRAAQLILQTAGGELLRGIVQAGSSGYTPKKLALRSQRIEQVLGTKLPTDEVLAAFTRLQLSPVLVGDRIDVTVPSHRLDLNLEVDLIEEAARIIGYDRVPLRDEISIRLTPPDLTRRTMAKIQNALVAGGYFEAVTFSFVTDALADDFKPAEAASLARAESFVRKTDAQLRPSIIPGLLEAVRRNEANGVEGARLFEMGSTFWHGANGGIEERRRLSLVGSSDWREVRGVVETILAELDSQTGVNVVPDHRAGFSRAACGRIEWGGKPIGFVGKIDRAVVDKLGLRQGACAAELDLPALLAGAQHVPQLKPLPRFPSVRRDLSLVVSEATRYESIAQLVPLLELQWLEDLEYVTTYRGKPLEKGQKSVTITLVFRSSQTTLTSEEVEQSVQRVIESARTKLNATLRA